MSHAEMAPAQTPEGGASDFKLEVVALPVADGYAEYLVGGRAGEELPS